MITKEQRQLMTAAAELGVAIRLLCEVCVRVSADPVREEVVRRVSNELIDLRGGVLRELESSADHPLV